MKDVEEDVVGTLYGELHKDINIQFFGAHKFSVSRITIFLSDFAVLIWLGILFYQIYQIRNESYFTLAIISSELTIAYIVFMGYSTYNKIKNK